MSPVNANSAVRGAVLSGAMAGPGAARGNFLGCVACCVSVVSDCHRFVARQFAGRPEENNQQGGGQDHSEQVDSVR